MKRPALAVELIMESELCNLTCPKPDAGPKDEILEWVLPQLGLH